MDGECGKGQFDGLPELAGDNHRFTLPVRVADAQFGIGYRGDLEAAGAVIVYFFKDNADGGVLVDFLLAEAAFDPIAGLQFFAFDYLLHQGRGFEDEAFVGKIGGSLVGSEFGEDALGGAVPLGFGVSHHDARCFLVDVPLGTCDVIGDGSSGGSGQKHKKPEAAQGCQHTVEGEGAVFFLIARVID